MKVSKIWRESALLAGITSLGIALYFGAEKGPRPISISDLQITREEFVIPLREVTEKYVSGYQYQYYCGPHYYGPVSTMGGWHYPTFRSVRPYTDRSADLRLSLLVPGNA